MASGGNSGCHVTEARVTGEHMAKILEFHCRENEGEGAPTAGHEGVSAEVIVFPGVRYERCGEPDGEDAEPGADDKRVEASERDRLELAD